MENYEQKYKEALERAKRCHKDLSNLHGVVATMSKDFFEEVFPELKESEDEKMIRIITKTLQDINKKDNSMMGDILLEDCTAWLEKKGEQKECLPYQKQGVLDKTDRKAIVREMQDELERLASVYGICLPDSRHDIHALCDDLYGFISKMERRNSVECMDLTNEFENQVSHLLASVLNGEWDYTEDFVRYAAKQLMGYARYEMGKESSEHQECEGIILSEYDGAMIDLITKALCELEEIHGSKGNGNVPGQYHSEREWLRSLRESVQSSHKMEFCSKCPFGETVSDPDPRDWFCRDDETVRCTKLNRDIASSIRPYQVGKVDLVPEDCPIKDHGTCENGIASNT